MLTFYYSPMQRKKIMNQKVPNNLRFQNPLFELPRGLSFLLVKIPSLMIVMTKLVGSNLENNLHQGQACYQSSLLFSDNSKTTNQMPSLTAAFLQALRGLVLTTAFNRALTCRVPLNKNLANSKGFYQRPNFLNTLLCIQCNHQILLCP